MFLSNESLRNSVCGTILPTLSKKGHSGTHILVDSLSTRHSHGDKSSSALSTNSTVGLIGASPILVWVILAVLLYVRIGVNFTLNFIHTAYLYIPQVWAFQSNKHRTLGSALFEGYTHKDCLVQSSHVILLLTYIVLPRSSAILLILELWANVPLYSGLNGPNIPHTTLLLLQPDRSWQAGHPIVTWVDSRLLLRERCPHLRSLFNLPGLHTRVPWFDLNHG